LLIEAFACARFISLDSWRFPMIKKGEEELAKIKN